MEISLEQREYYKRKLFNTIINYSNGTEYKFAETVSDCFRYLETKKDDEFKNIHERKKIFTSVLVTCNPEVQKFYFNLNYSPNLKDFYGVNKVVFNIIENYDEKMISDLLLKHNPDIKVNKIQDLYELSTAVFDNVDMISVSNIFKNYILPKDYLRNLSTDLGNNIKKVLNNEVNTLDFLNEDIAGMGKLLTLIKEKNTILDINQRLSRHLSSKEKKSSNKVEQYIQKFESQIIDKKLIGETVNIQSFFNIYVEKLNNLKIDVLNLACAIEPEKQSRFIEDLNYLKQPIENHFFENKLFNFLKNKISKIKHKRKITSP